MSYAAQVFWLIWAIATVVCAVFLPTAGKIVTSGGYIDRDTRGALAVLSIFPLLNVPTSLFAIVVCIGKFIEYLASKSKF